MYGVVRRERDIEKQTPYLFPELQRHTKLELFAYEIERFICEKGKVTNRDLYDFALDHGHAPRQARDVVRTLRKARKVICEGQLGFSYRSCYKEGRIKTIKAASNG